MPLFVSQSISREFYNISFLFQSSLLTLSDLYPTFTSVEIAAGTLEYERVYGKHTSTAPNTESVIAT